MIASLPMYDRPETAAAYDALWAAVSAALGDRGVAVPDRLTRADDLWGIWESPDLILAQTCSLPLRARLADTVDVVATADFGLTGVPPGYYNSAVIVRVDGPDEVSAYDGTRAVFNDVMSQSGWAALCEVSQDFGIGFATTTETGSHRQSARDVAEGRADIAVIDAVTLRDILRYDAFASALKVLHNTRPTPGLPFITRKGGDVVTLRAALRDGLAALDAQTRAILGIQRFVDASIAEYLALPLPPAPNHAAVSV